MDDRLREISMFFEGTDRIHQAMRKLAQLFDQHDIDHAIIGGMAVNAHGYVRTTGDVDFLMRREGFVAVRQLAEKDVVQSVPTRPRRFVEPTTGVHFDLRLSGMFPGSGRPGPIVFPDPARVSQAINNLRYINLEQLIQLKLIARRYTDLADVVDLIRANDLDESYLSQLHESVRNDFIECLEEKRREDEYEDRQDSLAGS
jgi:hypothetical protein